MRLRFLVLPALLALALPAPGVAAERTGFQLQADGLFSAPVGSTPSAGGSRMANAFNTAGGYSVTGSVGLSRHTFLALRAGQFHSGSAWNGLTFHELDLASDPLPMGGVGPFTVGRELTVLPVTVLLQHRRTLHGRWNATLELGGGTIAFKEIVHLKDSNGELFQIAGYQRETAAVVGAGLGVPAWSNFELVGSGAYTYAFVGDGAVFESGDKPAFVTWSLGLRYPRVTH